MHSLVKMWSGYSHRKPSVSECSFTREHPEMLISFSFFHYLVGNPSAVTRVTVSIFL